MIPATRDFAIGIACALGVVVLWSSFHLVSRFGVQTSLTPFDLVALRFGVGGLIMLPVLWRLGLGHLRPWQALILAFLAGPGFAIVAFSGFQFAPAAHGAAILAGAIPLFAAPIAWKFLGERLNPWQVLGLAGILSGICFLIGDSFAGLTVHTWKGDLLFAVGAADWAVFALLARAWRVEPVRGTALAAVISMIAYVPIHFALLPSRFDTAPLLDIAGQALYQGFFSMIISLLLFTRAVAALGATLTTTITAAVPATAAFAALILLGEAVTMLTGTGIALVTAGMLTAVLMAGPKGPPKPTGPSRENAA